MKAFDSKYLDELIGQAKYSPRLRQHRNIHQSYQDACQRLFNAIEPDSYIRPHRHLSDPKCELLITVQGSLALVTFDDIGGILNVLRMGSGHTGSAVTIGAEVPAETWHTVISLEPESILLEVKAGPFNPDAAKDYAPWAPVEGSKESMTYLNEILSKVCSGLDH